jgi:protein-disulfide isomerase
MSKLIWTVFALGLGLMLMLGGGVAGADPQSDASVVAEVGKQKITAAELNQREQARLLSAGYQYYLARQRALEDLIGRYLLEQEAQRQHVTVEQLVDKIVAVSKKPTEDELELVYELANVDQPFSVVREKLIAQIQHERQQKALVNYVDSLRSKENIVIYLAPPTADVAVNGAPTRGSKNATVRVIEFADYECPYCQKINPELKKLDEDFPGKIEFVYKSLPLPMHSHAEKAAEAALCARDQGKFWEFHDALYDNPKQLDVPQLKQRAKELKLDTARFDKCLDSSEKKSEIQKTIAEAKGFGVTGTPAFFINDHFASGALNYEILRALVHQQLSLARNKNSGTEKIASKTADQR